MAMTYFQISQCKFLSVKNSTDVHFRLKSFLWNQGVVFFKRLKWLKYTLLYTAIYLAMNVLRSYCHVFWTVFIYSVLTRPSLLFMCALFYVGLSAPKQVLSVMQICLSSCFNSTKNWINKMSWLTIRCKYKSKCIYCCLYFLCLFVMFGLFVTY